MLAVHSAQQPQRNWIWGRISQRLSLPRGGSIACQAHVQSRTADAAAQPERREAAVAAGVQCHIKQDAAHATDAFFPDEQVRQPFAADADVRYVLQA